MKSEMPDVLFSGKVRDTYPGVEPNTLVVVASDRISVFDVVLPDGIPGKGRVLTHMTEFWLTETPVAEIMGNHFISGPSVTGWEPLPSWAPQACSLVVDKLNMLPVEAIVRGYLTGSGWKEYQASGQVSGQILPPGMWEMEEFPVPLFTPSTKAEIGEHDENIDFEKMVELLGSRKLAEEVRAKSLEIYQVGAEYARKKGIVLVDTKLEFGLHPETEELILADEVLTPDSSRFVRAEDYEVGKPPVSMDKQFVRDYVKGVGRQYLTPEVISHTTELYGETARRLTGVNPLSS
jgi:phosphoribosylaminoimidazole-succinocarboxamide synthase